MPSSRSIALVLCGGQSERMGAPKPWLSFGPERLLQRVVRVCGEAADGVYVVAAPRQDLPPLPPAVEIVRDRVAGRGPLQAVADGLAHVCDRCDAVFVASCDLPLLRPAFIRRVVKLLDAHDAAAPFVDERFHPLAAAYRPDLHARAESLLAEGRSALRDLLEACDTRAIEAAQLLPVDPDLASLRNLNTPEDYHSVLAGLGLAGDAGRA